LRARTLAVFLPELKLQLAGEQPRAVRGDFLGHRHDDLALT
jgi:hypothetical protein